MKLCGIFLVLALVGAATAASIGQPILQQLQAFTSELDDGFVATLPKSAIAAVEQDKENSLEPLPASNAEENHNTLFKKSPALLVNEETHIPVQIVQDPENISTKMNEPVVDEDKTAIKVEEITKESSKVEIVNAKEEEIIASDSKKPVEGEVAVKVNTEEVKQESDNVGKSEEQLKQDVVIAAPSPPNLFQQGLATIQNIGSTIANLVIPNNNSTSSQPSIISNIQQTFQNLVNPQTNATSPAPVLPIFQQLSDFTTGVQGVIQTFQNVALGFFGNSNGSNRNTTILQQGIQALEQGVQTGLQNLNRTIQSVTNPSEDNPGLFQTGIQNLQQGVQNILRPPSSDDGSRPGVIQQTVQNLSQGLQSGVQTLNNTIQNIINPVAEGEAPRPGIVQSIQSNVQSIQSGIQSNVQSIQAGIQNLVSPATAAPVVSTRQTLEQALQSQLQSINNTLVDGVKSLSDSLENALAVPQEKAQVVPVGEVEIVDA